MPTQEPFKGPFQGVLSKEEMLGVYRDARDRWGGLLMFTVYERPSDYPIGFVARLWRSSPGKAEPSAWCLVAPSLDEVRTQIPRGLVCLARAPKDDPCIVETWI